MKSPFYFIAKPHNAGRYANTKNIAGLDFIVSTSEEDHKFSNRFAEVVELPVDYDGPVNIGDILVVHHNVFKYYNDMKGRQKSGKSFFKDDLFFIEPDQFFMYGRYGEWFAYDRYCFVAPVPSLKSYIDKPFANEPLVGEMIYPNEYLKNKGIKRGDIVCFAPDSEYEFTIDEMKLYRMFDHQITIKL